MRSKFLVVVLALGLGSSLLGVVSATPAMAAPPNDKCPTERLLTFPTWYRGLTRGKACTIVSPDDLPGSKDTQLSRYVWTIGLNILEIMIQLVAYAAVGFIIWGGFVYLTSGGSSDGISKGKKMILNAVIGLVISLFAVIAVSYIVGSIT